MSNRFFYKKVELGLTEDALKFNNPIELEYYLLESKINCSDELNGRTTYGIEIVKKTRDAGFEKEAINNIFCCKENVENILDKLVMNKVTPVGLPYIMDDIIGS